MWILPICRALRSAATTRYPGSRLGSKADTFPRRCHGIERSHTYISFLARTQRFSSYPTVRAPSHTASLTLISSSLRGVVNRPTRSTAATWRKRFLPPSLEVFVARAWAGRCQHVVVWGCNMRASSTTSSSSGEKDTSATQQAEK